MIYTQTDIAGVLVALAVQAVCVYAADGQHSLDYLTGNLDGIRAVALAHRCCWVDVFATIRANLAPGHAAILDAAVDELPSGTAVLEDGTACQ